MTAVPRDAAPGSVLPASLRRLSLAPAEGWATVALVLVIAWTVGWAIDDPRWVIGNDKYTDLLPWCAVGGAIVGIVGAKMGWRRWGVHLLGAVIAALVVPVVVGSVLVTGPAGFADTYRATAESVVNAWIDLAIRNRALTDQFGHYILALALLCWTTGQFFGYAVFGHRRPLDAVIVVGLVLLANMALTANDQLGQLIVFTLASLFLLARAHAFDEQTAWMRRRIGDPAAVRSLYLRGGTVFILLAVWGSLVLTATASSDPLRSMWSDVPNRLVTVTQWLQRVLPAGGESRSLGSVVFGSQSPIRGVWQTNNDPALTIRLDPTEKRKFYWAAVVYDRFSFNEWSWGADRTVDRAAGDELLLDTPDAVSTEGRAEVTFTVTRDTYRGSFIVSPQAPLAVDHDATVRLVGDNGFFGAVELPGNPDQYTMNALVPVRGDKEPGALTANRLRVAGQDYPDAIRTQYLDVGSALGPRSLALLGTMEAAAQGDNATWNPYDLASTMERMFRDGNEFTYVTNVQGVCGDLSIPECFATYRRGYCEYYATTMALLLRQAGVPARMVMGFLPGDRDATGVERILNSNAHAWVQVYFPGYGWVDFDPTGGGVAQSTPLPAGPPVSARPSVPTALPTAGDGNQGPDITRRPVGGGGSTGTPQGPAGPGPYILITVLLAVVVGALAFVAWQRGPRGEVTPDAAWRGVSSMARRFGFGPRPTETVYEYAGALGDVLPGSRPELQTVAAAKVEVAYGRRALGEDRVRTLRDAQRRLRVALLRLALRRKDRRTRR